MSWMLAYLSIKPTRKKNWHHRSVKFTRKTYKTTSIEKRKNFFKSININKGAMIKVTSIFKDRKDFVLPRPLQHHLIQKNRIGLYISLLKQDLWTKNDLFWAIRTFGLFETATAQQLFRLKESSMDEVIKAMTLEEKIDLLADINMAQ